MEAHTFFLHLLIILLSARIFAELAVRLQAPSVLGELFAGIILGPSLFGWIDPIEAIKLLAEIGIILLLFQVGLETDIKRLISSGMKSFVVALSGFVMPLVLGFSAGYWIFDQPFLIALFIGGTLTATSIGITVRVLTDLNRHRASEGQIVLGAAVLDDVLGVILLALLYEFSVGGGVNIINASKVLIFVTAFFFLAPVLAKMMSIVIRRYDKGSEIPGLIPTTILSLVLFFAWLAHTMGAPELLGGFAAGLALSRRFFMPLGISLHADEKFSERIENQMKPIVQLFTPIFFVFVGLSLNLREIDWGSSFIWSFTIIIFIVAVAGKIIGALFIDEPIADRLIIGIAMVPRGEVGLIFAELGRIGGIFNNEIYAGMILVIVFTTLLSPITMNIFYKKYGHKLRPHPN